MLKNLIPLCDDVQYIIMFITMGGFCPGGDCPGANVRDSKILPPVNAKRLEILRNWPEYIIMSRS